MKVPDAKPVDTFQGTEPPLGACRQPDAALVERLRTIAGRVEALPLDAAADVLVLVTPALEVFERQTTLPLDRAPRRES